MKIIKEEKVKCPEKPRMSESKKTDKDKKFVDF